MDKNTEEMMQIFNKWNLLNPHQTKKPCEKKKNKVFDESQIENLSYRKPSLPNISPMSNNRNNYFINSKPHLGRKSMFFMDKSFSTNNLNFVTNNNTNFFKKDQSVYIDFQNPKSKLNILQRISGEENHTYEFVKLSPENPENPYLELQNPNLDDNVTILQELGQKLKKIELNESIFLENSSEILDYPYKPKNSLEIIRKKIRRISIKSDDEIQGVYKIDEKIYRPHSQEGNFIRDFSEKFHDECSNINTNCTKLSNDSGIYTGNMTNQQSSSNLILSISQGQNNSTDSVMNSIESIQLNKKHPHFDFSKTENDVILSSQESSSKVISINNEEDYALLRRMISNELTKKCYSVKEIIKFYFEDKTYSSQIIDESECAVSICDKLVQRLNKLNRSYWQLFEFIQNESLERPIEDHENIQEIFKTWDEECLHNRFILKENLNMYNLFLNPNVFSTEMENNFQISGLIWIKEINSRWKKVFASISESNVYFGDRPDSKNIENRHLFVNLREVDFYTCTDQNKIKRIFKAPTNELIIFKSKKLKIKSQDYPCICALTVKQKERWFEALKIAKFTFYQLQKNYLEFEKKSDTTSRTQSYPAKSLYSLVTNFYPKSV